MTELKKPTEVKVWNHGVEHSQYFNGHGLAFSSFTDTATGVGDSEKEAFEDALELLAQNNWDAEAVEALCKEWLSPDKLSDEPIAHINCEAPDGDEDEGENDDDERDESWHEECELHVYISIDVK